MKDLIDKQKIMDLIETIPIDTIFKSDPIVGTLLMLLTRAIEEIPSEEKECSGWISCSERLPEVTYDELGNWYSDVVILRMNDEEFYKVECGNYNPCGVFEGDDSDGIYFIGKPIKDVKAWMPFPGLDEEEEDENNDD